MSHKAVRSADLQSEVHCPVPHTGWFAVDDMAGKPGRYVPSFKLATHGRPITWSPEQWGLLNEQVSEGDPAAGVLYHDREQSIFYYYFESEESSPLVIWPLRKPGGPRIIFFGLQFAPGNGLEDERQRIRQGMELIHVLREIKGCTAHLTPAPVVVGGFDANTDFNFKSGAHLQWDAAAASYLCVDGGGENLESSNLLQTLSECGFSLETSLHTPSVMKEGGLHCMEPTLRGVPTLKHADYFAVLGQSKNFAAGAVPMPQQTKMSVEDDAKKLEPYICDVLAGPGQDGTQLQSHMLPNPLIPSDHRPISGWVVMPSAL